MISSILQLKLPKRAFKTNLENVINTVKNTRLFKKASM